MRWTDVIRRSRPGLPARSSDLGQWVEAALLVMLVIQVARLLWALATPVGLFGDWRAREPVVVSTDARTALFAGFDPFFRAGGAAADGAVQQVTSLPLQLFGIRLNEASGQGSAIIANESGDQLSYAVGDEIAPGVTLEAVHFDHVVIQRGGASETLYIDQSGEAPVTPAPTDDSAQDAPDAESDDSAASAAAPSLSPQSVMSAVDMEPRNENGNVTGIVLNPRGDGAVLSRVGFRPGDIIVQVNGRAVTSMGDINQLQAAIRPGARLSLMVERGAATVPISLILPES